MYVLDKRIRSKCKFADFRLLTWKLTKFLKSFLKPQVSFSLNFASPFSVIIQNPSEIFWLKHYILRIKKAHQCTIFQTFECSIMKVHPISHAIFETTIFQCHERKLLCILLAQTSYTLDKNSPSKWNFWTFEWLGENSPNSSCHIWNHKSVFL